MSSVRVLSRAAAWSVPLLAALLLSLVPAGAGAAQRLEEFDLPSTHGNIDESTVVLNKIDRLKATVMLPDGYDANPTKAWPVVYMLQGIGDNSEGWANPSSGSIQTTAKGLPAIVVMPESGRGFLMDWWEGGARSGPRWTQYFLDDVIPTIESRYRILPGRQNHAIAGISMGGYGAVLLGGQLPGYFGSVVSMSGLLDSQSVEAQAQLPDAIGAPFAEVWGPPTGPYATVSNPLWTTSNVAWSRLYVSSGNGIPDLTIGNTSDQVTKGGAIEAFVLGESTRFAALAAASGADVSLRVRVGLHAWQYWRRELPKAIAWNLFAAPKVLTSAQARNWSYQTMAPHGNAWGLGYRFAAPTTAITTLTRTGQTLRITGGTGTITINPGAADADASGDGTQPACSFTATIPVTRTLPAGC
ncbi:MAG: alpha/beta hydrolase-fold protein [Solirubrobacteraceae bacterium]|nr:alpha/beta hydrolase-fold protein [Patulibacter sp.]